MDAGIELADAIHNRGIALMCLLSELLHIFGRHLASLLRAHLATARQNAR